MYVSLKDSKYFVDSEKNKNQTKTNNTERSIS